jgi:hypothetical protein
MTGLLTMTILVSLTGLVAMRFGVDTRDGQDWHPQPDQWQPSHRPARRAGGYRVVPLPAVQIAEGGSRRPGTVGDAA